MTDESKDDADILNQQDNEESKTSESDDSKSSNESSSELEARLAKAEELASNYKIRAEKAEKLAKAGKKADADDDSKSNVLSLGAKAFLTSNGIKGSKEFEFVQDQMKKSGKDVESLLENGYFKTELENFRALAQTADATPTGKRSSGVATDSVEYWVAKAGPNAENLAEVPTDMRAKVVNAIEAKAKNSGKFYNQN